MSPTAGWGWAETIAFAMLAAVILIAVAGGVLHAIKTAYTFGQHAQRMSQAEENIKNLQDGEDKAQAYRTEMAVLAGSVGSLKEQLQGFGESVTRRIEQLDHDLRNLLTGKIQPARRRSGED